MITELIYVSTMPCAAYSLNLVVNDVDVISHETVNFFDIVQEFEYFAQVQQKGGTY